MPDVVLLILPVFGLILVGFVAGRIHLMDLDSIRGLSRFAFRIAIPVMLGRAMAQLTFAEPVEWQLLIAYYSGTLVTYFGGIALSRWLFTYSGSEQAVFGLGSAFANVVVLGIPVVLAVQGASGELPMYMIISLNSATLLFVASALVNLAREQEPGRLPWKALGKQATHPIVVGLAVGLTLNLLNIRIPAPIDRAAEMLAAAAPPCALFALGASLSLHRFAGGLRDTLGLVILKNAVHPLCVYVMAVLVLDLSRTWAVAAVLLAAQPMGVNVYLFAEDSEILSSTVGKAFLVSTLASMVTVPVLVYLIA